MHTIDEKIARLQQFRNDLGHKGKNIMLEGESPNSEFKYLHVVHEVDSALNMHKTQSLNPSYRWEKIMEADSLAEKYFRNKLRGNFKPDELYFRFYGCFSDSRYLIDDNVFRVASNISSNLKKIITISSYGQSYIDVTQAFYGLTDVLEAQEDDDYLDMSMIGITSLLSAFTVSIETFGRKDITDVMNPDTYVKLFFDGYLSLLPQLDIDIGVVAIELFRMEEIIVAARI